MGASNVLAIVGTTLKVGLVSTALVVVPGVLIGWLLARRRFRGKALLQTVVSLPMVLPPVAVGLLLLYALGGSSPLGSLAESLLGRSLLLSWQAAALAAACMSLPLVVLGARQGFESVPHRLEAVAETLGASRRRVFLSISLPLAARGILYGVVFAFARGLGEFGATTLVAGNVPGQTETLALGIYARIQEFDDRSALLLAGVSTALALVVTGLAERFLRSGTR